MTTVTVVEDEITLNLYDGASPASVATVASDLSDHEALSTTAHGGIVADSDSRLTDARTPTAHASTHATEGGTDPLTHTDIGADAAGSAATVQSNLDTHEGNATNPHSVTAAQAGAEPGLGNPATDGFVLSSTIAGIRTWIEMAAGGGGDVEEAPEDGTPYDRQDAGWVAALRTSIANTWTAVQTFSTGIVTGIIKPAADATDAIQIQDAGGAALMIVDTTNSRVGIGSQPVVGFQVSHQSNDEVMRVGSPTQPVLRIFQNSRQFSINNGSVGGALNVTRIASNYIATFRDNSTLRGYINDDGTQVWYLGTAGSIAYSQPGGYPGITIHTGSGFDENRFDIANTGAEFKLGYNSTGSDTLAILTNGIEINGAVLSLPEIPTSAPATAGHVWNDGGTLKISAG